MLLTYCNKKHVIKYCELVYKRDGKTLYRSTQARFVITT